jgi:uncharacterized BrkB/YihY/UPF0761 family membrane protein
MKLDHKYDGIHPDLYCQIILNRIYYKEQKRKRIKRTIRRIIWLILIVLSLFIIFNEGVR